MMIITGFENIFGTAFMIYYGTIIPNKSYTTFYCEFCALNQERKLVHVRYTKGCKKFSLPPIQIRRPAFVKKLCHLMIIPITELYLVDEINHITAIALLRLSITTL